MTNESKTGIFGKMLSLKDEQERVQKKTFTKWINCYLSQRNPPKIVKDIFVEFSDGLLLLELLEMLTKTPMVKEKPKNMQRIHCITNVKAALEYMENVKKIKLVNINPSDIVDGKPSIVLGLVWTLVLFFQIEEQEEFLLHALGLDNDPNAKVKGMAKKALMAWSNNTLEDKYGLHLKDFGESWRDGQAFSALVHNINPDLVDMDDLKNKTNKERLDNAFNIAENELGIPRLLDSEDVDVQKPDEKSIMTYVAQFLKSYPEGKKVGEDITDSVYAAPPEPSGWDKINQFIENVNAYSSDPIKNKDFDAFATLMHDWEDAEEELSIIKDKSSYNGNDQTNTPKDYEIFATMMHEQQDAVDDLDNIRVDSIASDVRKIKDAEKAMEESKTKLKEWQWNLDKDLPGKLGSVVAPWLRKAENFAVNSPLDFHRPDIAQQIEHKLKDHKDIFDMKDNILQKLISIEKNPPPNIPHQRIANIRKRLDDVLRDEMKDRDLMDILSLQSKLNDEAKKLNDSLEYWSSPVESRKDFDKRMIDFNSSTDNGNPMDKFGNQLHELINKTAKYFKENPNLDQGLDEFLKASLENCESHNDVLPSKFDFCCGTLENMSSAWADIGDMNKKIDDFLRRAEKSLEGRDLDEQKILSTQIPEIKDLMDDLKRKLAQDIGPHCNKDFVDDLERNIHKVNNDLLKVSEEMITNIENQQQEETRQLQAAQDATIMELSTNGDEIVEEINSWFLEIDDCLKDGTHATSDQLKDVLKNLDGLCERAQNIDDLIANGYNVVEDLKKQNAPEKASELQKNLDNLKNKLKRSLVQDLPNNKNEINNLINVMDSLEKGITELNGLVDEGSEIQKQLEDVKSAEDSSNIQENEKSFLDKESKIKASIERDKNLLKKLKDLSKTSLIQINPVPLEKQILLAEEDLNKLLKSVQSNLNATEKCGSACDDASHLLDDIAKKFVDIGQDNDEVSQKESLSYIQDLENDLKMAEKKIENVIKEKNECESNLDKAAIDKINTNIMDMRNDANDLRKKLIDKKKDLGASLTKWDDFKNNKSDIEKQLDNLAKDLNQSHESRNGSHGRDYEDKVSLLKENQERLDKLNDQRAEIDEIIKLANQLNSEKPNQEAKELKDKFLQQLNQLENEIKQNNKDIEDHKQFDNELSSFGNWIKDAQELSKKIDETPNTKDGLLKKQKLLDELNNLKIVGDSKLKLLKDLEAKIIDETAPDMKQKISFEVNKETGKFNNIFGNLDNSNDDISETITKLEKFEEQCSQLSGNVDNMDKELEQVLQQPKDTVTDKENKEKDLIRLNNLIDEQKVKVNDLLAQSDELGDEAKEEMLSKLKLIEDQLARAHQHINEELAQNKSSMEQQAKLEGKVKDLDSFLSNLKDNVKVCSKPTTTENETEENINKLDELENELLAAEDMIESAKRHKNEAIPYMSKAELSNIDKKIKEMESNVSDLKDEMEESRKNLSDDLNKWNIFNENKDKATEFLDNMSKQLDDCHQERSGVHGGDCDDKATLLKDNEKRLAELINQEVEIDKLMPLAGELHSSIPIEEIEKLKKACQKQMEIMKNEITSNRKDLEDHIHFDNELNSFKDLVEEAQQLSKEIDDTPNTKEGLLKKQKLMEKLNALQKIGSDKFKELKTLENVILNETAPDSKDRLKRDVAVEQDKFRAVFGDIDSAKDAILDTISRLEKLEDVCDELTGKMSGITKQLDQSLQQPRNSIEDKENLRGEMTNFGKLIDDQKRQVDDLLRQANGLSDEAKEELMFKVEALKLEITNAEKFLKEELSQNQLSIEEQSKLEDCVNNLGSFIDKIQDSVTKCAVLSSDKGGVEDNLSKIECLENDISVTEDMITQSKKQREEAAPYLTKSELDKIDNQIDQLQNKVDDLRTQLDESKQNAKEQLNKWNTFNDRKDDAQEKLEMLSNDLEQCHKKREGIHGGDINDKALLLEENENRLSDLNDREKEIEELLMFAKDLNSEIPIREAEEILERCREERKALEKEISRNQKDLDDHKQFQEEITSFRDWIKDVEDLNKAIEETPNTKEGLLKKQKLLEQLNNLKSPGNNKLKDLRNLQNTIIPETAPNYKDQISTDVTKECDRFNAIFGDIDNCKDDINETITKLEKLEEQCEGLSDRIEIVNGELEKSCQEPRNTVGEKEKLDKDLNRLKRTMKEQMGQINELLKEADGLSNEAREEMVAKLNEMQSQLAKADEDVDEELVRNRAAIGQQSGLENSLNNLDSFIEQLKDKVKTCSVPASGERGTEEKLNELENLEKELSLVEDMISKSTKQRDEATPYLSKSELDKIDESLEEMLRNADNLKCEFTDTKKNVSNELDKWNMFNETKESIKESLEKIDKDLENCHKTRKGIHGGDCEDKSSLLKENEDRLARLNQHEKEIEEIMMLAKSINSDAPIKEVEELKRICQEEKRNLEREISGNLKDLEDHKAFEDELTAFSAWLLESEGLQRQIDDTPNTKEGLLMKQKLMEEILNLKNPGLNKLKDLKSMQNTVVSETAPDSKDHIFAEVGAVLERFDRIFGNVDLSNDDINDTIRKVEKLEQQSDMLLDNCNDTRSGIEHCLEEPKDTLEDKEKLAKELSRYSRLIDQHRSTLDDLKRQADELKDDTKADIMDRIEECEKELDDMQRLVNDQMSQNKLMLEQQSMLEDSLKNLDQFIDQFEDHIADCSMPADNEKIVEEKRKQLEKIKAELPKAKTILEHIIKSRNQFDAPEHVLKNCDDREQKFFDVEDEIIKLEKNLEMTKNNWEAFNSERDDLESWVDSVNGEMAKLNDRNQGIHGGKFEDKERLLDANKNLLQDVLNHEAEIKGLIDRSTPLAVSPTSDSPTRMTSALCKKYEKLLETLTDVVKQNQMDLDLHDNFEKAIDNFSADNNRMIKDLNEKISSEPNTKEGLKRKTELYDDIRQLYSQRAKILPELERMKEELMEHSSPKAFQYIEQLWDKIVDNFEKMFSKTNENQSKLLATVEILDKTEANCDDIERKLSTITTQREQCAGVPISSENDIETKLRNLRDLQFELNELQSPIDHISRKSTELPMLRDTVDRVRKEYKTIQDNLIKDIGQLENSNKDLQNFNSGIKNLKTWLEHCRSQFRENSEIDNVDGNCLKQKHVKLKILQDDIAGHKVDLSRLQSQIEPLIKTTRDTSLKRIVDELTDEYRDLHDQCQSAIDRYDRLMKLMNKYEQSRATVLHWIDGNTQVLLKCSDYSMNTSQIRSKLVMIENLEKDLELSGQPKFIEAIQDGEDLLDDLTGMGRNVIERQVNDLKSDWTEMCRQLNNLSNNLRTTTSKSDLFKEAVGKLSSWLDDMEHAGMADSYAVDHQCQRPMDSISKNAQCERVKTLQAEVERHRPDFEQLHNMAAEMSNPAFDLENSQMQTRFNKLLNHLKEKVDNLEKQEADFEKVKQDIENVEKWIFKTSIQIINENSGQSDQSNGLDQDIDSVLGQNNDIIQSVLDKEPEVLRIQQAAVKLLENCCNQPSQRVSDFKEDVEKMNSNFNNLKATALNKKATLLDSCDKWANYQKLLDVTKDFLDNDLKNWWFDKERSSSEMSFSTKDREKGMRDIEDIEQKIIAMKRNVEKAAQECDGIPPKITNALSRTQTPIFQYNKVSSIQSPLRRSSSATPDGRFITNKQTLDFEQSIQPKVIFEKLEENLAKLSAKKQELQDKYNDWNNFSREKSAFKNWFDNIAMKFKSTLQSSPKTSNPDDFQRSKIKSIQDEIKTKKPTLTNLMNRFSELTPDKPYNKDPVLKDISEEFERIDKDITRLLNREDKEVEVDFTEDDSKDDILQEVFVPKLALNASRMPSTNGFNSSDNLHRFTQTLPSKNDTSSKKQVNANFGCQTPSTKMTQTLFEDPGTDTTEYSKQSSRSSKRDKLSSIANKISDIRNELDRSRPISYRRSSPTSLSSRGIRPPNQESVRRNMIPSPTRAHYSRESSHGDYTNDRTPYNYNSVLEFSSPVSLKNDDMNEFVPTKDKWHDLEVFLQSTPKMAESLQNRPTPNREFQVSYRPPQEKSGRKSKRSQVYEELQRLTKDTQELRSMNDRLKK